MAKKYLIVDIDETLVYSRGQVPGSIPVNARWQGHTIPRPDAHEFLTKAKDKGWSIVSVTQGIIPYQVDVLSVAGLMSYIEDIYGWLDDNRSSVHLPALETEDWVMVDNLHYQDGILLEKQSWLRTSFDPEVNFVQCEGFWGNPNIAGLCSLLPTIEELLSK